MALVILLGAVIMDALWGEVPTAIHPVGWMGNWISSFRTKAQGITNNGSQFLWGLICLVFGTLLFGGIPWIFESRWSGWGQNSLLLSLLSLAIGILFLKGAFAYKALIQAGRLVQNALDDGDLPKAQELLAYHLVSREVKELDGEGVASATVESLAENLVDSVAAPLMFYGVFGLAGAYVQRFADTADSMLGYRDAEREWLGKAPARWDDALCFIPARMAGYILLAPHQWKFLRQEAKKCPSPNSGWPVAAMAFRLGICLKKPGVYVLNPEGRPPQSQDISKAIRIIHRAYAFTIVLVAAILIIKSIFHRFSLNWLISPQF